jgi:hypothetical protein
VPAVTGRIRAIALALAIFLSIAGAFRWVRDHTPSPVTAADAKALKGTLVYAADDGAGWARLWRWNLSTDTVQQGPRVRDPIELVSAYGADPGVVGVTSRTAGGDLEGSLLRFLSPNDEATRLVRGDLVAWGPQGETVVALDRTLVRPPCERHLTIVTKTIVPPLVDRQYDRTLCGDILSVGRDSNTTYLTIRRDDLEDRVDIVYAGYGRTHPVLNGYALLSISPAADMLVVPEPALTPDSPVLVSNRSQGDLPPASIFGTALFFRGLGVRPRPYRSDGDQLWVDRVLTWSSDSLTALVAGHLGDQVGMYEITAGPSRHNEPPRFIGPIEGSTWATPAEDNVLFLVTDERVWVLRDGRLEPLAVPDAAPDPDGPIVWLP